MPHPLFFIGVLSVIGLGVLLYLGRQGLTEPQVRSAQNIRDVWDFSNPADSEGRFRELAGLAEQQGDNELRAEAWTQVARAQGLQRKFDEATSTLDRVEADIANAPSTNQSARIRLLLERGRVLNSGRQPDAALPFFEQAFELAVAENEGFLAGDAAHMAGIASDIPGEERWISFLNSHVEENPHSEAVYWVAPMHNNLGWSYFFDNRFEEALSQFLASRDAYASQSDKGYETLIADYSRGRVLRALDRCAEALLLQEATFDALRSNFDIEDEFVAEELALCHARQGNVEAAREPAALALEKLGTDNWIAENEPERLNALRSILE